MGISAAKKAIFNRMNGASKLNGLGDILNQVENVVAVTYDFAVSGGAVSDITLGLTIPATAIVRKVFVDALTAPTSSGSATVLVKAGSTALTTALAYGSVPTVGDLTLAGSATAIKLSADSALKLTIGTAALTAGKIRVFVVYALSQDS